MAHPVRGSPLEAMGGDEIYQALIGPAVSVAWAVAGAAAVAVWAVGQVHHPHIRSYHPAMTLFVAASFLLGAAPMGAMIKNFRYPALIACGLLTPGLTAVAVWAAGPDGASSIAQCYVFFGCSAHLLYRRRDADLLLAAMLAGCGVAMALSHTTRTGIGIWVVVICETSIVAVLTGWLGRTLFGLADAESAARGATERTHAELDRVSAGTRGLLERASHGLRTPLNSVVGFSELLGTQAVGALSREQSEYVRDISSSGRHLRSVLDDIAAISVVEGGSGELRAVPVDVGALIAECVGVVQGAAADRLVTIDVVTDDRLGLIEADSRKIKQILLNLVANAVRFSPAHGRVRVEAVERDGGAEVSVRDEGPGIDPSDHERIFLAFEQGATTAPGGTGLGLAVSRGYAAEHGGRVSVESAPGEGATFRLWLPARPATDRDRDGATPAAPIVRRGVGMWDDGGVLEQLVGRAEHRRFLTRMVGTLAAAEGLVLCGAFLLPSPPGFELVPTLLLGAFALLFGAVLLWWPRPQLTGVAARLCCGVGIGGTALAAWFAGSAASASAATVFVVIGILAFEGLAPRAAAAAGVGIGIAYAIVLAFQGGNAGAGERWSITMSLVVAGGMMARWFVNLVPELARSEQAARAAAENANSALIGVSQRHREMLAHVSHELRTPLNAIIGFGEALQSGLFGPLNPDQSEYVHDIVDSGRELLAFVNDILELSRAEAGRVELDVGPASMRDVISAAVVSASRERAGPSIVYDLDPAAEDVQVDARRLAQAVGAIVTSAITAAPPGSEIRVVTRSTADTVTIAVSDSGPPGERTDARSEVGLLLAGRLAEMHGGRLNLDNPEAGETTVRLHLPARAQVNSSA